MKSFRIEIITKVERNEAISLVREAISASEGWIVTHQLFSNISASIIFEMPHGEAEGFMARLQGVGFSPTLEGQISPSKHDIRGALSLTFIHDEPDMKRNVPAFG